MNPWPHSLGLSYISAIKLITSKLATAWFLRFSLRGELFGSEMCWYENPLSATYAKCRCYIILYSLAMQHIMLSHDSHAPRMYPNMQLLQATGIVLIVCGGVEH